MKLHFFLIVSGLLASCSSGKTIEIEELFRHTKTTEAKMIKLDIPSEQIIEPIFLTALNNKILSGSFFVDPMIGVYEVDTQTAVKGIQPKGKSKYEMIRISSMYGTGNELFIYSSMDGKVFWRRVDSLHSVRPERVLRSHAQERDFVWFKMVPVAKNRYVASGIMAPETKAQFALLDSALRVTRYFDSFPLEGTPMANLTYMQQCMGMQGTMTPSPDGHRMMWTPVLGTIFRFYDFSNNKPVKITEYILHVSSFSARESAQNGVEHNQNDEWGTISSTADEKHFYALYSSKTMKERILEASDIYVFDLSGKPVRHIMLDRPATQIVWVPETAGAPGKGRLFAFGKAPDTLEPEIFEIRF